MAITTSTARDRVKQKLDIASADTSFDTLIDACLGDAMPRLASYFVYDIPENLTVTLATDDDKFTLPVSGSTLHKLYGRTNVNEVWRGFEYWSQHGDVIYLNEGIGTTYSMKILARRPYSFVAGDLALLPVAAEAPLLMFACAEFAIVLVGNKRKFNLYQQSNGSRTLDEMRDLSEWYDARGIRLAEDAISAEAQ